MKLLNVGCGRCFHPAWTNIDLVAASPEVREYDLRRGLPYADATFDGVYHSHVLEHLSPDDAAAMIRECRRVLKPNGILRVVVPDLEGIARTYLQTLDQAARDQSPIALANHQWMIFELVDQMTRRSVGGRMGQEMRDRDLINRDFVQSRLGHELHGNGGRVRKTFRRRITRLIASVRKQLALATVTLLEGSTGREAYREGRFRQSGEIHRWMYDRVSLSQLLVDHGFERPRVCGAGESEIAAFDTFQLDRDGDVARKPDSLYLEATKPETASLETLTSRQAARAA